MFYIGNMKKIMKFQKHFFIAVYDCDSSQPDNMENVE